MRGSDVRTCPMKARHFFHLVAWEFFKAIWHLHLLWRLVQCLCYCLVQRASWYLTNATLDNLENFQCTLGKKILRLHSNTSVLIGLDWPSMRARVLIRKLSYLKNVLSDYEKLRSQVLRVFFRERDNSNLTIIEQYRYLEGVYGINFSYWGSSHLKTFPERCAEDNPHCWWKVSMSDTSVP